MTMRKQACAGVSVFSVALALLAAPASAQSGPDTAKSGAKAPEVTEIIVTGSRIARRDDVAQSPIATTSAAAVAQSGAVTVDSYLRSLPQFQPGSGDFSNNSNGGTIGQSTLNLRGLGAQRNLVLLDGRRLQPSDGTGAIDINTIPAMAIGNIEVISGGASATYGSDAMSGVVNFRLRNDLKGLEISGQSSITGQGDGAQQQIGAAYGARFADGRGKLLLSAEYVNRDGISTQSRSFFRTVTPSGFLPQGYFVFGANTPSQAAVNGIFANYGIAPGTVTRASNFSVNSNGSLFVAGRTGPTAYNYQGPTTGAYISNATGFGYNGSFYNFIRVPLERIGLFGRSEYEFSDKITGYAQLIYSRTKAQNRGAEPIAGVFGNASFSVAANNPFIPADLKSLLNSRANPTADFLDYLRVSQVGPRNYQTTTNLYQAMLGLKGDLGHGLKWELYGTHGETRIEDRTLSGAVSYSALNTLSHAADGGASLCAGGFNPFGVAAVSQSCLDYISRKPINRTALGQNVVEASLNGDIIRLPGGMAKFDISASYRNNTYTYTPDPMAAANDLVNITSAQYTHGLTSSTELAGELLLPLLADKPLVQAFNVTLGYRYSRYNLSGGAGTWKADFDWRVVKPILLRGGYQHALRAPSIGEYFAAPSLVVQGISQPPGGGDPCDFRSSLYTSATTGPSVRGLCVAQGMSSGFLGTYNNTTNIVTQTQGNNQLTPESANTLTIGAVLSSPFATPALRNLSISVDYYHIKIKNAIGALAPLTVLQKCFNADGSNPGYDPTNGFCKLIQRGVNGALNQVNLPFMNLGGYDTSGIDIALHWRVPVEAIHGGFNLESSASYLNSFAVQTVAGGIYQENAGTIAGNASYPRWNLSNAATLSTGPVSLTLRWRHLSAMGDSSVVTNPASTVPGVPAYDYIDLSGRIDVHGKYELRLGVTNLTDKAPPVVGGTLGATNAGVYDVIGRTMFVGMKAKF